MITKLKLNVKFVGHNIGKLVGQPFGSCSNSDLFLFKGVIFISSLTNIYLLHFNATCNLSFNGFTKI
jgi:hypothetical protein